MAQFWREATRVIVADLGNISSSRKIAVALWTLRFKNAIELARKRYPPGKVVKEAKWSTSHSECLKRTFLKWSRRDSF